MIHDPGTNDLIRWSDVHDDTVYVHDVAAFSEKVLPHYFAHSNWPSFVRQLNSKCVFIYVIIMIDLYMFNRIVVYGFRRVKGDSSRGSESYQFAHEDFTRNGGQRLHLIKRKGQQQGSGGTTNTSAITNGNMELLDKLFDQLNALESECAAVVSETQTLHRIYAQQQQV